MYSRNRDLRPFLTTLLTLLCTVSALTKGFSAPTAADGWKQIYKNHNEDARTTFRTILKQNPNDVDAIRGLALIAMMNDDVAGQVPIWSRLFRTSPTHWATAANWVNFLDAVESTGRYTVQGLTAQEILKSNTKPIPPELRTAARLAVAHAADFAGTPAIAEKAWTDLGYIRQWNVIGPFENVSRSGFTKAFPPEQEMRPEADAIGRNNLRVRWRRLANVTRDGKCLLSDSVGDEEPDVIYASTAIQSPAEQSVILCFDPEGASKLFLNGTCIFADEKVRKRDTMSADPFQIPVTLHAGWNNLLVKLAGTKSSQLLFRLRFMRPDGKDLPLPIVDPTKAVYTKIDSASVAKATSATVEPAAVIALRKLPPTPETLFLIGLRLEDVNDNDGAIAAMHKALELAPEWAWLHWKLSETLSDDGQTNEAEAERDLALKYNPNLIPAAVDELNEKSKERTPAERIKRLTELLAVNPTSASVHHALYEAYSKAKLSDKALASARAAFKSEPGPSSVDRVIDESIGLKHEKEAEQILSVALHDFPASGDLHYKNGSRLEQRGQNESAIAAYRTASKLTNYQAHCWQRIATLYQIEKQWKSAVAAYEQLRRLHPQNAEACSGLAEVYRQTGRKSEAVALYKEAIQLAPARVELRDKLQLLTGEKPVSDLGEALASEPILAQAKTVSGEGTPAKVLLDEGITVVYPDYASVTRYHQIIKIFDDSGVKHYVNFYTARHTSTSVSSFLSARLIKASGKVETIDISDAGYSITFPSLSVGDTIDVVSRVEDYPTGALGRHFWGEWFFDQENVPVQLSRFVLITPPGMAVRTEYHGTVPTPTSRTIKEWNIREWKRTNLPALPLAAFAVARRDRGTWIDLSTFANWKEIVQWYQDISSPLCIPDAAIKKQALELTQKATTEQEKIRALVSYVSRKIQYESGQFRLSAYVPTEGKQVLREHYGDCKDKSALLVALLAAVSIRADMVLISGRDYGITPYLPSPRFNHAITRIHTSQGDIWVDGTADKLGFGYLPYPDQQVPALIISPETSDLVLSPVEPIERNRSEMSFKVKLDEKGRLAGKLFLTLEGNQAWRVRAGLVQVSPDQYPLVLKNIATQVDAKSVYEDGKLEGMQDQDVPVKIEVSFHIDNYSTKAGNFLLTKLPWVFSNDQATQLGDEKRREDLEWASQRRMDILDVEMELPTGYEVQDLKSEVKAEFGSDSYRFAYKWENGKLYARFDRKDSVYRIPAANQQGLREFIITMGAEGSRQWVLKKIEGTGR